MTKEIWKAIKGYEGIYEISSKGNVRLCNGKILKGQIDYGYKSIILTKNKRRHKEKVHRLVATTFIPNPMNYPLVNHKDENPLNNHVENLEWCTYKYNTNYGSCIARRSSKLHKKVLQYSGTIFLRSWNSIKQAAKELNIDNSSISKVASGKRKTAGGFIWKYDN